MGVGEEVAEPGVREMLLDATPVPGPRPIGALRQPAPLRRDSEQTTMLLPAHRQLQPDALVTCEQRQVAVRGSGADDFQAALLLEAPKGGHQVPVDLPEQCLEPGEPRPPELHRRPGAARRTPPSPSRRWGLPAGSRAPE